VAVVLLMKAFPRELSFTLGQRRDEKKIGYKLPFGDASRKKQASQAMTGRRALIFNCPSGNSHGYMIFSASKHNIN